MVYCWSNMCGRKARLFENVANIPDFAYFIDVESTGEDRKIEITSEPVCINQFLQVFVADQLSDIGEKIEEGEELSVRGIAFKVVGTLQNYARKIGDINLEKKSRLLGIWFSKNYKMDTRIVDDIDFFKSDLEPEMYEDIKGLFPVKEV